MTEVNRGSASTGREVEPRKDVSLRTAAIVAGTALLLEAITQPIAVLYIFPRLIVPGDAATTASNIRLSADLFRLGIGIILGGTILDILVAWALYVFFRPAGKSLALLVAILRLTGMALQAVSVTFAINALLLVVGSSYTGGLPPAQLNAQAQMSLGAFQWGYDFALIYFGSHLMFLGYLVFRSGYLSRGWGFVLAVLLVIAGAGYVIDNVGRLLIAGYTVTISSFTFVGEVALLVWLLVWGTKVTIASAQGTPR